MCTILVLPVNVTCTCSEDENLLEILQKAGLFINAPCGGKGICGKCRIRVVGGTILPSIKDESYFSQRQLEDGFRLACCVKPQEDCTIEIVANDESHFSVINSCAIVPDGIMENDSEFGVAIDIGTTTLAVQLIDTVHKTSIASVSGINHQRAFGSDVISRIMASNEGKKKELQESIRHDILELLQKLCKDIDASRIKKVVIAANTTMIHLLCGFSCETLGVYPFTPVEIDFIEKPFAELFGDTLLDCTVTLLPGISTYVGADIVAGLDYLQFSNSEKTNILVDLGTNGEMAIGNKDKILVTSVAAGPAFEGGNISCGTGSIPGAIATIDIEGESVCYTTIQDEIPVGICGTGVVECASELLKAEFIDETGMLDEDFCIATKADNCAVCFTPKDVREIQLAKAAIRAGIEVLIAEYGISYDEVDTVYIAGGFGFHINLAKALFIGMFPQELREKLISCGNTSLQGAITYLLNDSAKDLINTIVDISSEIGLSTNPLFNDLYMEHMLFEL